MNNIIVKIIQDSICNGIRITTFELEYQRFIHAEFMTHRLFSRNAASSRAIPFKASCENIKNNTATPVHWGQNQPGMQAKGEVPELTKQGAKGVWEAARDAALSHATVLNDMGIHKQIVNRIPEPFSMIKVVLTATELANWYWLRAHEDAQPEIYELATKMLKAQEESTPMGLSPGQWHLPYIDRVKDEQVWYYNNGQHVDLETAKMISASCCAQVSYRKTDDSIDKARMIYQRLIESTPCHASPVEHQATPMQVANINYNNLEYWQDGTTHLDRGGSFWSGNFRGWIQNRQLIPNNAKW